jgi:hypothetical protein
MIKLKTSAATEGEEFLRDEAVLESLIVEARAHHTISNYGH